MGAQIIIVDDDPLVGGLTLELLTDAGYSARLIQDSMAAGDIIRTEKPALVILDILMPGLDGLTLLHMLKTDPETKGIRAIVVSGKSFQREKERATQYGAEAFIEKPYDVEKFAKTIDGIMGGVGGQAKPAASAAPPQKPKTEMEAVVWGCRAAPAGERTAGRHTACVSVETPSYQFIFDAGSGAVPLGESLLKSGKHKTLWMFLTHFHPDHVEGLASFPCAKDTAYTLHIGGVSDPDKPLEEALLAAFGPDGMPPARVELYEMIEQAYEILPGVRLTAFYANHPGTTLAYSLQAEGKKIVYCPDSELYGEFGTALQDYDEKIGVLCRGADLLFHDGRFSPDAYKENRNLGHSSYAAAVDFAGKNLVKNLVLVHQDYETSDETLDAIAKEAQARAQQRGYLTKVQVGREGLRLTV